MNAFMISCDRATLLIEKKISSRLTLGEKFQLRFHTMMCDACRRYEKQSAFIEQLLHNHHHPHAVNDATVEKVIEKITKKIS